MEKELVRVLDFAEYPGVRYIEQGDYSGEEFYVDTINPLFKKCISENKILVVDLDGTAGYASSFLDECFGNLVYDFEYDQILLRLEIISLEESDWQDIIFKETLPEWPKKMNDGQPRKQTS